MTCSTIVDLPIGSNVTYGFVFKDALDQPIDLAGSSFVVTMKDMSHPARVFDTDVDLATLYIEEDASIQPVGEPAYIADRLILALTPVVTRSVPPGALTSWEIERRADGDQRNWGAGMFRGYGGMNPDV